MVKPVPLTMSGSPNNCFIASSELAAGAGAVVAGAVVFSVAACAHTTMAIRAAERISFNFIMRGLTYKFQFSSKTRLQLYHFYIADVSVFLQLIQDGRRRHAVQAQYGQGQAANGVAAQTHAGNVDFMPAQQGAEMPDD